MNSMNSGCHMEEVREACVARKGKGRGVGEGMLERAGWREGGGGGGARLEIGHGKRFEVNQEKERENNRCETYGRRP